MALRPTIYKCTIALSDLDRQYYDTLNLTVAKHPSETDERMMVRILAYCIHAGEGLTFGRGLSTADEPDLWIHTLDNQLSLWVDVGEPAVDRIKKASRIAGKVIVYSFNSKSSVWWQQNRDKLADLQVAIYQLPWQEVARLTSFVARKIDISVTLSGDSAYIVNDDASCEVIWSPLQA